MSQKEIRQKVACGSIIRLLNLIIFIASNANIQQFHETLIFLNLFRKNDIFFKITWWMKTILTIKTKISTH